MVVRFKRLYEVYLGIKIQDKGIITISVSIWNEGKYGRPEGSLPKAILTNTLINGNGRH